MIPLLLLIPTIVIGAGIDWSTCIEETVNNAVRPPTTKCFMHDKCKSGTTDDLFEYWKIPQITECGIGYQTYFFSEDTALIQMQVTGKIRDNEAELAIHHGTDRLFGCKRNNDGKIEIIGDEKLRRIHEIDLFEERSSFGSDRTICAFKLNNMRKFSSTLKNLNRLYEELISKISYFNNDGNEISFVNSNKGLGFFSKFGPNCNPYDFMKGYTSDEFHILPIKDLDRSTLDCTTYKHLEYVLKSSGNGVIEDVESLICERLDSEFFKMKLPGGAALQLLENPYDFDFFCAAKINKICENPYPNCAPTKGVVCPQFTRGTDANPAEIKCPSDKWLINGEYYQLKNDEKPVCKSHDDIENTAAFFIKSGTLDELRLDATMHVTCFTDYDCSIKSDLAYIDCEKGKSETCGPLQYKNVNVMKCEDESQFQLSVMQPNSNVTLKASNYTCDRATGDWKDDNGVILKPEAQVSCAVESIAEKREATFTEKQAELYVWVAVGVTFVIAGILFLGIWIGYKHHKLKHVTAITRNWKKTKQDQRLVNIRSTFSDLMTATADSEVHIVHGFEVFEMLLSTNTEDPAVWEEVYPFLMRVLGAFTAIDFNAARLYCRYLYVQAKKIIDKYGWRSLTPITNANHDGLMRSVAVHLLALAVNDSHDEDVLQLIENGFRELGFNAVAQYPHCGVMWSLITQIRGFTYDHTIDANTKDRGLDIDAVLTQLRHFVTTSPSGLEATDIIPQFGSISEQACFALGGTKNDWTFSEMFNDYLETDKPKDASLVSKFISGAGYTLSRDPGPRFFISAYKYFPDNMEKDGKKVLIFFHDLLAKIAPVEVWSAINESIVKILIFFQRSLDAKNFEFLLLGRDKNQSSEIYSKLRAEQELFEEAVTDQIKQLWDKLSRVVDIEELKKRPTELIKYTPGDSTNPWEDIEENPPEIAGGSTSSSVDSNSKEKQPDAVAAPAETAASAAPEAAATPPAPVAVAATPETPKAT